MDSGTLPFSAWPSVTTGRFWTYPVWLYTVAPTTTNRYSTPAHSTRIRRIFRVFAISSSPFLYAFTPDRAMPSVR